MEALLNAATSAVRTLLCCGVREGGVSIADSWSEIDFGAGVHLHAPTTHYFLPSLTLDQSQHCLIEGLRIGYLLEATFLLFQ